ncbi:MAG: signal transduction histidine kinase/CheY-like chemotaxis protein [Alphaproteobacteria bacterium]
MRFNDLKTKSILTIVMTVLIFNGYSLLQNLQNMIKIEKENLEISSQRLIESQLIAATKHYWTLDFQALHYILDGFQTVPEFSKATFYDENNRIIAMRSVDKNDIYHKRLTVSKDIYANIPNEDIYLGKIVYEASYEILDNFIYKNLLKKLSFQLMLFVSLCIFIYMTIDRLISKPLKIISNNLTRIAAGDLEEEIPYINREDEVGKLAQAADIFKNNAYKIIQLERVAREKAEEVNKQKDFFLARVTHELRTPLHGISGFTKILLEDLPEGATRESMRRIDDLSTNMTRLVNEVLDFSSASDNEIKLSPQKINLKAFVDKIAISIALLLTKNENKLHVDIDANLPDDVLLDDIRFEQIMFNLLSNANKFTKKGVITITLKVESVGVNFVNLYVAVTDTGEGVSDEFQKNKIFEPFTQEDEGINRKYGGTGLGLAVSQQMVKLMNGELKVESEKGKGSIFYFTIPVYTNSDSITPEPAQQLPGTKAALTEKNILVADDDPLNRMLLKKMLVTMGHNITLAKDGDDALNKLEGHDLIFMDVMMPNKDGIEATKEIRQLSDKRSKIPIIAVTAYQYKNSKEICMASGMDDFISKPFDIETIRIALFKYLGGNVADVESEQ